MVNVGIGIYGEFRFFVYPSYLLFVCCLCDEHTHRWADTKPDLFNFPRVRSWEGARRLLIFIALSDSYSCLFIVLQA